MEEGQEPQPPSLSATATHGPQYRTSLPMSDKHVAGEPGREISVLRAHEGGGGGVSDEHAAQLLGSGRHDLRGCCHSESSPAT